MSDDDEVLRMLISIDRRLALLTATHARDLRKALEEDVLKTANRIEIWDNINGRRAAPDIVKETGGNLRVTQKFVKELLDAGFIRDTNTGAGTAVVAEHDDEAILRWYVDRKMGA